MTIITAIPMNDDHIAGHFAKAERFVFVDEQGSTLAEIANPVAGNECKSALAELLQAQGARRIVLKNIGSKMLGKLLEKQGLGWPAVAYMGDDLMDLSAMTRCGMAIAPATAHTQIKARSHLVTQLGGGKGAVREAVEFILDAQGKLAPLVAAYLEAR